MWINVTSVLWMVLCLVALIGSGAAISLYIPIAVVVVPVVWAGLNSSMGMLGTWCYLAVAAVPFVLLTAVNSALVFLYAMATLDRSADVSPLLRALLRETGTETEWGVWRATSCFSFFVFCIRMLSGFSFNKK